LGCWQCTSATSSSSWARTCQLLLLLLLLSQLTHCLTCCCCLHSPHFQHLPILQILLLSRLTAVGLLAVYIGYLIFQLGTHKDMFAEEGGEDTQQANMTLTAAGVWLAGITVVVAFLSEFLTGSIEEVRQISAT
jgi:Ca2+/H+ antiporter